MEYNKSISILVLFIVVFAIIASLSGILSDKGTGEYNYESIRGKMVTIYGKGVYKHMSSDVAIQGISQDYVTLFVGIPLLLISFLWARKNSIRGKYIFAGTSGYFFVSYLFYMCMGMFNAFFLFYVTLTSLSFFSLILALFSLNNDNLKLYFNHKIPNQILGVFLIFNSIAIALMWLSVILPPLINGTIYPLALDHYTTLIVQGLDLSILLPISFLAGIFLLRENSLGFLMAPVYIVFLSILMTALTAKVIGMGLTGVEAGPAIVIIPLFNLISIAYSIMMIKNIKE